MSLLKVIMNFMKRRMAFQEENLSYIHRYICDYHFRLVNIRGQMGTDFCNIDTHSLNQGSVQVQPLNHTTYLCLLEEHPMVINVVEYVYLLFQSSFYNKSNYLYIYFEIIVYYNYIKGLKCII